MNDGVVQSNEFCRRFSFAEIQSATDEFDEALVIGKGGFGKVYKGFIDSDGGATTVAIKRLDAKDSKQGAAEFWAEIKTLSKLRHRHLLTLIGYSDDSDEMILVYEYMSNGTLADHLYSRKRNNANDVYHHHLTWEQRLTICVGAARGLDFLHSNTEQSVIHRDVKTTNILLDENWVAKISDFGLSKMKIASQTQSFFSTDVKGTFGYLDPQYFLTRRLTKKSDVYALGVVLFEVLCGRPAVDATVEEDQRSLSLWVQQFIKKGTLDPIIDPSLKGKIWSQHCLKGFVDVAKKCICIHPNGRPTMAEVVGSLELMLVSRGKKSTITQQRKVTFTNVFMNISQYLKPNTIIDLRWSTRKLQNSKNGQSWRSEGDILKLYRCFSLAEIRAATKNFHEDQLIGHTDDTKVYLGLLMGNLKVAIKRWKKTINQRQLDRLIRVEIQVHSQLRHLNIVSLIGYCNHKHEVILVYEYMVNGSLHHRLYEAQNKPVPWIKRLEISIGVARGLQYLHSGTKQTIIHRNLKPGNIFLDENWVAKVSEFEFSTVLLPDDIMSNASFSSLQYMDPEYLATARVTVKSDVYSFGVILLELLCGRKPLTTVVDDEEQVSLVNWFKINNEKGAVDQTIDPYLIDKIAPECLKEYVSMAEDCVRDKGIERPSMDDVLGSLRYALQLQETWQNAKFHEAFNQSRNDTFTEGVLLDVASTRGTPNTVATSSSAVEARVESLDTYSKGENLSTPNLKVYTFADLKKATRNFRPDSKLGEGGFGSVFRGWVDEKTLAPSSKYGSGMIVAIKKLHTESMQGFKEWQSEVSFLGRLSHPNLVKLFGYCWEDKELLLVYEYMQRGSLENHLFIRNYTTGPLSWDIRLKIAIDAARGLAFLHTLEKQVIYRDFKASNILLDENYNAKLSDFGLARSGPYGDRTHVSTAVKGTYGYAAPEYMATGHLTVKSDVYGFGVVLLEMLTGSRALDFNRPRMEHNLVDWAKPFLSHKRKHLKIMDARIEGQYSSKAAFLAAQLTLRCLEAEPKKRPSMKEVVEVLEQI